MNTDTKELVKKVFGKYALMIRKAHGHWALGVRQIRSAANAPCGMRLRNQSKGE